MDSTKEKFLQTLAISDEGIEMMLQRVRRMNPGLNESEIIKILKQELKVLKDKSLPKHLKPVYDESSVSRITGEDTR
jgi:hypothetical protein